MDECSDICEKLMQDDCSDHHGEGEQDFVIENDEPCCNSEQVFEIDNNDLENESEQLIEFESNDLDDDEQLGEFESNNNDTYQMLEIENNDDVSISKDYLPPVVGMEFDSYEDAYNYYNCYAKELGFAIRVKSSWTKRNSKEKRGAVLCCNCEGFKALKEASSRRRETRTGCLAMLRLRLVESNRWRVDEVKLEHNHLFDPERAQNSKSQKKIDGGVKRKVDPDVGVEVRTIKLYRTHVADSLGYGSSNERESSSSVDQAKHLDLKKGDPQFLCNYFSRVQLTDPNFFYVNDFNDEGYIKNVFWIESRARAAYGYFCDVVAVDTMCLSSKYEIPIVAFIGVNHHGHSILLGCSLIADECIESFVWLLRTWLTCMSGRPPQTIITDQSVYLQAAIAEVFPRAHHRLSLPHVIQYILEKFGELGESDVFQTVLTRVISDSLKSDDFEIAWEDMIQRFGIKEHDWLKSLYEDRERWGPVYLKDTFFAGMSTSHFFNEYMNSQTSLTEFFDTYELILQKKYQKENIDDFESREYNPTLKTGYKYEAQVSEIYTKELFLKFQYEVEMIRNCVSVTQVHASGAMITYMVKEVEAEGNIRGGKSYEVMYDKVGIEVRCFCSCFNFKGYLCRHALSVLKYNGIDEIPSQYILSRWRKDFKRLYVVDVGLNDVDVSNPVQWFDHLYKRGLQVVEEGMNSQQHYTVACQALKESLNKVRLVADNQQHV